MLPKICKSANSGNVPGKNDTAPLAHEKTTYDFVSKVANLVICANSNSLLILLDEESMYANIDQANISNNVLLIASIKVHCLINNNKAS